MASSEERVELTEERELVGLTDAHGQLVRASSPTLKKAMGKLGIRKVDLVPPLRATFDEECRRDGVTIPDVMQKRWEVMEQRRLDEIDEILQHRQKSLPLPTSNGRQHGEEKQSDKGARSKEKEHARKRLEAAKRIAEEEVAELEAKERLAQQRYEKSLEIEKRREGSGRKRRVVEAEYAREQAALQRKEKARLKKLERQRNRRRHRGGERRKRRK